MRGREHPFHQKSQKSQWKQGLLLRPGFGSDDRLLQDHLALEQMVTKLRKHTPKQKLNQ